MYQKAKAEKAAAEAERAKYDKLKKTQKRGEHAGTPEVLRKPIDIRNDPRYEGQTTFMIEWVPLKCRDETTLVDEVSLRDWILFAAVEEDPASKQYYDDIDRIDLLIQGIDANLLKIPKLEFLDEEGKPYTIEKARNERENLYNILSTQRVVAEEDKELAERNLSNHVQWRRSMGVELTKGDEDKNTDTCTWFVRFFGTHDAKEIEDLLIQKEDWPGINLAVGNSRADPPVPPWVGRDKIVPDGSKANATVDYTTYQVNIAGARLLRIPAGVGLIQQLDRESSSIYADEFGVFYGSFEAGRKSGYGIEIDDTAVFAGAYEDGAKNGRGRMDLADGTTITGMYGVKLQRRTPECKAFINPYKEGEPNGPVEVYFGDGAYFKGIMENGRINGPGDYQSALNELISGNFLDGVLHGEKGFVQNQIEDVYMGTFRHGELHGQGVFQNKRGDSYEGYWQHNMRHGRGMSKYARSGCFRGFYINNLKHGKGSLEYGYSKSRFLGKEKEKEEEKGGDGETGKDKAGLAAAAAGTGTGTGAAPGGGKEGALGASSKGSPTRAGQHSSKQHEEPANTADTSKAKKKDTNAEKMKNFEEEALNRELSEFNNIYQGFFIGNGVSNRGSTMNTRLQMPCIISRLDNRATYGITKVLKREERLQKSASRMVEKFNDMEGHIREEIQKKKIKIYNQQKHFTKKTMYAADSYGLGQAGVKQFESKLFLRKERLNNLTVDNHLFKKAVVPRLRVPNNSSNELLRKALDRIRPERGEIDPVDEVDDKLLNIVISDFEEIHERQRFLKYDRIWQRAEDAYIGNRSAAV